MLVDCWSADRFINITCAVCTVQRAPYHSNRHSPLRRFYSFQLTGSVLSKYLYSYTSVWSVAYPPVATRAVEFPRSSTRCNKYIPVCEPQAHIANTFIVMITDWLLLPQGHSSVISAVGPTHMRYLWDYTRKFTRAWRPASSVGRFWTRLPTCGSIYEWFTSWTKSRCCNLCHPLGLGICDAEFWNVLFLTSSPSCEEDKTACRSAPSVWTVSRWVQPRLMVVILANIYCLRLFARCDHMFLFDLCVLGPRVFR